MAMNNMCVKCITHSESMHEAVCVQLYICFVVLTNGMSTDCSGGLCCGLPPLVSVVRARTQGLREHVDHMLCGAGLTAGHAIQGMRGWGVGGGGAGLGADTGG